MASQPLEVESYVPTDSFFGQPYIDVDEWREAPYPHRHVHGGFGDTATRFTFYFPKVQEWQGRMYQPIEGAHAGHEEAFGGPMGELIGGLAMTARLGGYMSESNSGHVGDDIDPRGGEDPGLYGWRATAESARFSKHIANQVYGRPPQYSYVWGGSGGGRRSPLSLENAPDVFDGALPFMGGGDIAPHGTNEKIRGAQTMSFGQMFNVQRLLGDKLDQVIDAMRPGGSGNPFTGLDTNQREELANLYRLGFPRGDEYMISQPMGQIWLWSSMADGLLDTDADYFESFWTRPGYVGHDAPQHVVHDRIDLEGTVSRILTPGDFLGEPEKWSAPEHKLLMTMATLMGATSGMDLPMAVEIKGVGDGYRLGTGVKITSGAAAGRQLYCTAFTEDIFFCDGVAEANLQRFRGVEVGDTVHVDNQAFLAYCYYSRHHLMPDEQFDFLRVDGNPLYPSHDVPLQSSLMGVSYSGQYDGKLLWVHHTHDSSLWPPQGIIYRQAVEQAQGEAGLDRFCLRWTDNAEHVPPMFAPSDPQRATATWLVNYQPIIEQSLVDLARWVEDDVAPAATAYTYHDGKISLPATASERGGIQPVVTVEVDGSDRAEVGVGTQVTLVAVAEVPPGAGKIIAVEWDIDGSGSFAEHDETVDGSAATSKSTLTTSYAEPGTYFVTARVTAHREGDVTARSRRVENLASARIVVA
ncbi:tannase/feruloyl esterase family alpha/beta hydrolase [Nocardia sp. NBC_00565]|uniref:tannase/feruloyl esterase family alpha/beta hydrolase n=1 Tax=Nocardia sp. NBC_00565 TaxID=2975993 RepID=UPI002E802453|nr:tannase/feruloyl esterase family alpha/beta hydrolase [Nocardia sp. NBC_00565]WUC05715.1 tannase/feruloyl esterase family alpha/beta hydrolase [Nocardia sp. NBC_00565]